MYAILITERKIGNRDNNGKWCHDMNRKAPFLRAVSAAAAFALFSVGCSDSKQEENTSGEAASQQNAEAFQQPQGFQQQAEVVTASLTSLAADGLPGGVDASALFTERDRSGSYDAITADISLNGDSITVDGAGASAKGCVLTITEEGTYRLHGTLADGQVIVDSDGKVQLLLDGADITCTDSAGIYVKNAKKAFLTTTAGSVNSVTDGGSYVYETEGSNEPDAAIFSTDDLTLNGNGTLLVQANYNEGITCKDNIVITGGTIGVNAPGNGIKGKDYVAICGGDLTVTAGADGIKSNNTDDPTLGFVRVEGGTLRIGAQEDGVQAESELHISGGTIDILAGGGTANAAEHTEQGFGWYQDTTEESTAVSTKALKAGTLVCITGGTVTVDAADDALHTNGSLYLSGGTLALSAGGDGIHADAQAEIASGTVQILQSYEGIEAADILISGGTVEVHASDDGINCSDGTAQGGMGTLSDCALEILDGVVYIDADGDGLDSNGTMLVAGGTVLVHGPTNGGNGALDGNGGITCSGGLLIAAGSMAMAEYPSGTQNCLILTLDSVQSGGTLLTLYDENGELLCFAPEKEYQSVIISTPLFQTDSTVTACLGGSTDAAQTYGLYETGGVSDYGTEAGSTVITEPLSYIGSAGGAQFGGHGGNFQQPDGGMGMPGGDFQMPDGDFEIPEGDFQMPSGDFQPPDAQGGFPAGGTPPAPR